MVGSDPARPPVDERRRWTPRIDEHDPRHPDLSYAASLVWDGVVWGRLGRADDAWRSWDAVRDPSLASWVAAERGRVLRELGLHAAARDLEEEALAAARDVTDAVMLRISLAADALGIEEDGAVATDRASRQLDAALALLEELPPGPRAARQRLRGRWVGVEIALARGDRPDSSGLAAPGDDGPDLAPEHEDGTDFHRAKSLLFAGIARGDRSLLVDAARLAPPALRWAVELARVDAGEERASARAVEAWAAVRPPPGHEAAVAATPTARRLRALA